MTQITGNMALGRLSADTARDVEGLRRIESEAGDRAEIKKVADQFESLFLNMVLKSMRSTVQKTGLVDGGHAEEIYRGMLDDEYAQMMASQRQTGIANQIEDFMLKAQGLVKVPEPSRALTESKGLKTYQDAALQTGAKRATMDLGPAPRAKAL